MEIGEVRKLNALSTFSVKTPAGLVRIRGTVFSVEYRVGPDGIGKIVVNVHYRAEQIEQHLAASAADLELRISDERELLRDTGGVDVRFAHSAVVCTAGTLLVCRVGVR